MQLVEDLCSAVSDLAPAARIEIHDRVALSRRCRGNLADAATSSGVRGEC